MLICPYSFLPGYSYILLLASIENEFVCISPYFPHLYTESTCPYFPLVFLPGILLCLQLAARNLVYVVFTHFRSIALHLCIVRIAIVTLFYTDSPWSKASFLLLRLYRIVLLTSHSRNILENHSYHKAHGIT